MATPASIRNHPIHPMLIALPLGLWSFSFICDFVHWAGWGSATWSVVSLYCMGGGIAGALLAAIPGLIDYQSLRGQTRKIAAFHMILNVSAVVLFAANLLLRINHAILFGASLIFSGIIMGLLGVSGWLGGELVYVHRVGIADEEDENRRLGIDRAA